MTEFVLPDTITEVKETNPVDLIIVAIPKMGKSTVVAELTKGKLGEALLFNLDKNGTDYLSGKFINIYPTSTTSFVEAYSNYIGYRDALLKAKGKYKYLIVDTLTDLDEMSELGGTYAYMYGVPQGKNFNRDTKTGAVLPYGHPEFKMVSSLPEGYGYKHTRKWFLDQIAIFSEIAPYRIYTAHVKDKLIKNAQDEVITGMELNLTGKLKQIMSTKISCMCKLVADDNKRYLSFEVDNDNIIAGSRVPHLEGQVLISDKDKKGNITTYWENIYK